MLPVVVPGYINHLGPIDLHENTTPQEVMNSINAAEINNPNIQPDLNIVNVELRKYKLTLAIDYLSQTHQLENLRKGQIISVLESYILNVCTESVDDAISARSLITKNEFRLDPNLQVIIEKIDYASKNIFYKYLHNLKKEASGISPAVFLTGIGALLGSSILLSKSELIEDEDVASGQKSAAFAQMGVGISLTITPFIIAGFKTVMD